MDRHALAGVHQYLTIAVTAVAYTGTEVTYTAEGHGLTAGEYVTVTGFTDSNANPNGVGCVPSAYNNTNALILSPPPTP